MNKLIARIADVPNYYAGIKMSRIKELQRELERAKTEIKELKNCLNERQKITFYLAEKIYLLERLLNDSNDKSIKKKFKAFIWSQLGDYGSQWGFIYDSRAISRLPNLCILMNNQHAIYAGITISIANAAIVSIVNIGMEKNI